MSIEQVIFDLTVEVNEKTYNDLRRLETTLYRAMGLLRRISGSENVDDTITKIMALIRVIHAAQLAYSALLAVRAAAGDPLAWAGLGISATSLAVTFSDTFAMAEVQGR